MKIHKFLTEKDAQNAIALINAGEGLGDSKNVTSTYTTYQYTVLNGFFIIADDITLKYIPKVVNENIIVVSGIEGVM